MEIAEKTGWKVIVEPGVGCENCGERAAGLGQVLYKSFQPALAKKAQHIARKAQDGITILPAKLPFFRKSQSV